MDAFEEFLKNSKLKEKSIEKIALSDYDYFMKIIKGWDLGNYEKKHDVNLTDRLAELYLSLNDYVPAYSCGDCEEPATAAKVTREGGLCGAIRSYCRDHGHDDIDSHQVSSERLPLIFNARNCISGKGDKKKFDRYLMKSLGLKSTKSADKMKEAIYSKQPILPHDVRAKAKKLLVDYLYTSSRVRNSDGYSIESQEFIEDFKERVFEFADDQTIGRLAWIFYPMIKEGVPIIYSEFKNR